APDDGADEPAAFRSSRADVPRQPGAGPRGRRRRTAPHRRSAPDRILRAPAAGAAAGSRQRARRHLDDPATVIRNAMPKARILVIDDEAEIRRSVRMILEYEGYDVQEAASGPEGVALAEREPPDLIFLDIKMGGMDGLEALQKIRQANEALPVVIVSGHGTVSTAVEATKLGAFDFIEKPLASERVLVTIRNA